MVVLEKTAKEKENGITFRAQSQRMLFARGDLADGSRFAATYTRGLNVAIKIKKQIRVSHWKYTRCLIDVFQFGLEGYHFRDGQFGLRFHFNNPEAPVQFSHVGFHKPQIQLGRKIEHRKANRHDGHNGCNRSLYVHS